MSPRLVLLVLMLGSSTAFGADDAPGSVAESLKRRIIGPDLGLSEVQLYAEQRIPKMSEISTLGAWQAKADQMRSNTLDRIVFRGEAANWRKLPTRVEWLDTIEGGPGYKIKKLRYEAVPGYWIPALLYEPENLQGKVPAVLNFDGHDSKGMFADYKQIRCINLAKRGMLALNVDWIGMGELKSPENAHGLLNAIDLSGTSGISVFYLLQTRAIDVLLGLEHTDPTRIAATGLSGGGWQTIFLGALDTRVTLLAPVAGYSSFRTRAHFPEDLGDSEQTPADLATVTDYALMTAMLAPRAALLTFNTRDNCCFAADHALPLLEEAAKPVYKLYKLDDKLRVFLGKDPGTHNYYQENRQAFYRMVGDQFYAGQAGYSSAEVPVEAEVKTVEQLTVPLPEPNASLHSLALDLAKALPRKPALPETRADALAWQTSRRTWLREVVKFHQVSSLRPVRRGEATKDGLTTTFWEIHLDEDWTVPAVELARGPGKATLIIVSDRGRSNAASLVDEALTDGFRVLVVDPFDIGESKIAEKGWLWHLYLSTVGHRTIGLRASELAAIARWSSRQAGGPVAMLAEGPQSSLALMVAAAIEPDAIAEVELRQAPGSLKEPIEAMLPIDKSPDSYCFGLLEEFDVPQIIALIAPRKAVFDNPSPRAKREMTVLKPWYKTLGLADFNPAP